MRDHLVSFVSSFLALSCYCLLVCFPDHNETPTHHATIAAMICILHSGAAVAGGAIDAGSSLGVTQDYC